MEAILKWFLEDGELLAFATTQEFSIGDHIRVKTPKENVIKGKLLNSFNKGIFVSQKDNVVSYIDFKAEETLEVSVSNCYKVLGKLSHGALKMIQKPPFALAFYKDGSKIKVQEETKDFGFAGKHGTNIFKVKCACCDDFK